MQLSVPAIYFDLKVTWGEKKNRNKLVWLQISHPPGGQIAASADASAIAATQN